MNELPPVPGGGALPPPPPAKSFYHHAATASVCLIFLPFVVNFAAAGIFQAMDRSLVFVVIRLVAALLIFGSMLAGVGLGIAALFGIPKYGTKGILIKALFGILVPLLFVALSIPVLIHAKERAEQIRAARESQQLDH